MTLVHRGHRRAAIPMVLLTTLGLTWLLIGPAEFGGPVSLVSTHGNSMLPTYEPSDLVVLRSNSNVDVGDAVAYRSDDLNTVVLHRIVSQEDDGFVLSGDNNDWLDTDRPTIDDIIGKAWFSIPAAGRFLDLPPATRVGVTLGAIALVGALMASRSGKRHRHSPRPHMRSDKTMDSLDTPPDWALPALQAGAVALVVAIALVTFGFTRSASEAGPVDYTHHGEFTYHADTPRGPAYPDGELATGDVIYRNLIDEIDITFAYRFAAPGDANTDISGDVELVAEIANGNGWSDTLSLDAQAPIEKDQATVQTTLDFAELDERIDAFEEEAGVSGGSRTVTITPQVAVEGALSGQELSDEFVPTLELRLGEAEVRAQQSADDDTGDNAPDSEAITVTETGNVSAPGQQPATTQLLGREFEVGTVRWVSVIGGGLALLITAVAGSLLARLPRDDPHARAEARHSRLMIPVDHVDLPPGRTVIDMGDLDALARLAQHHETPILRFDSADKPCYLLEHDGTVYRHQAGGPPIEPHRDDLVPPPPPASVTTR